MPNIDISPVILAIIIFLPALFVFLVQKSISNKQKKHFLSLEKETLHLNATILDLEKEIIVLRKALEENNHTADIVRMEDKQQRLDDKQKSKVI